jgi:hypothetical protein
MESHLTTKTLSFFSILEQTWHFIEVTSPTSLKIGFAYGIFKAQTSWISIMALHIKQTTHIVSPWTLWTLIFE